MTCLEYSPLGPNLWAVARGPAKVGEVAFVRSSGEIRFIPAQSYAFTAEELGNLRAFMDTTVEEMPALGQAPAKAMAARA